MPPIRKTWWSALALSLPLAFAVGCGDTATPPADVSVPSTTSASPVVPAPTKPGEPAVPPAMPEVNAKAETPKTDEHKDHDHKAAAPAVDAPKVDAPKVDAPKTDAPKADAPKADAPKTASAKLTGDEIAEIKKLPAGEVDAALKQAVCPVSDEHLGGMGAPIKIGRASCRERV